MAGQHADNSRMAKRPKPKTKSEVLFARRLRLVLYEYDGGRRYYRPAYTVRWAQPPAVNTDAVWDAIKGVLRATVEGVQP
jgi:hypothetical protein